jgi:CubicO group peptidase (beta-lactamase class C family)
MTRFQANNKILNRPLKFKPGEQYAYSNSGYILLAAIIERVTGKAFQDFVKQEVLTPLGLKDFDYSQGGINKERLAIGYGNWERALWESLMVSGLWRHKIR